MKLKTLLTNTFGFDSLCFVCDQGNDQGLRQRFYYDDQTDTVTAEITPSRGHSGAPSYAHGGFSMAVLDDAMAWAVIAIKKKFGLSQHIEFDFRRPVKVERLHLVEAWIDDCDGGGISARAEMRDAKGRVCMAAVGRYIAMSMEQATQAIGASSAGIAQYTSELGGATETKA